MPDIDTTIVQGVEARGYRRGGLATDPWDQYVIPVEDKIVAFRGRGASFRIPGRGAATQALMTVWNGTAAGSGVSVDIDAVSCDIYQTVAKGILVPPPIIRLQRLTIAPTGGTALPKVPHATAGTPNALVTLLQDASADGTSSTTALTATPAAGTILTQEYAARLFSAAGYEIADRVEFLSSGPVTLLPTQGAVLFITGPAGTSNPTTDMWISTVAFKEYTRP